MALSDSNNLARTQAMINGRTRGRIVGGGTGRGSFGELAAAAAETEKISSRCNKLHCLFIPVGVYESDRQTGG